MHHPHAANALLVGGADKSHQRLARLVGAQAMQIDLALHRPLPPAQLGGDIQPDAGAAKTEVVVGVEHAVDINHVADRFLQGRRVVACLLLRNRCRWCGPQVRPVLVHQGLNHAYRGPKQVVLHPTRLLRL